MRTADIFVYVFSFYEGAMALPYFTPLLIPVKYRWELREQGTNRENKTKNNYKQSAIEY